MASAAITGAGIHNKAPPTPVMAKAAASAHGDVLRLAVNKPKTASTSPSRMMPSKRYRPAIHDTSSVPIK
jgi:hypothetical protein